MPAVFAVLIKMNLYLWDRDHGLAMDSTPKLAVLFRQLAENGPVGKLAMEWTVCFLDLRD